MLQRREFLGFGAFWTSVAVLDATSAARGYASQAVSVDAAHPGEDLSTYIMRQKGTWDDRLYRQLLGAANEFKEGDAIVGVGAADEHSRIQARQLLSRTALSVVDQHPPFEDQLSELLKQTLDADLSRQLSAMTFGELKTFLLERSEAEIHRIRNGLSSDVIACVVRLMNNDELIRVGAKVFNPLPGSLIGSKGYMGARVQPNSPTDNLDDITWQVFNAFAYGVGDVLLGTNPVSSEPESVAAIEKALQDILVTFGIDDILPHCVLSHIDVQAEAERRYPRSTELWFQSIAGNDNANRTFDISVEKMSKYASERTGRFGLYFETGQGADFTNGHGHDTDMLIHESRKYGFARALSEQVRSARSAAGHDGSPWVHVNDVAGFIGPEVFRTREQLVRCCLEDIVMGKLHGLMIGLDVCSTLHMDVSLDDLEWCIDQIMPANPGYLMALPTRIDPMLGYLTTGFQDHVRVRQKFGYSVNDGMWQFFQNLNVIDQQGDPTSHFGDPVWVYLQYRRAKSDSRTDAAIMQEGHQKIAEIRGRGVFIAEGFGDTPSQLNPKLDQQIHEIYNDARECIWQEVPDTFAGRIPSVVSLKTRSANREDYILHPVSGEHLSDESLAEIDRLRASHAGRYDSQIVVSDGLNALAVTDEGQLEALLQPLRAELQRSGFVVAPENLLIHSGRVRAGYRTGERLFGGLPGRRTILHVIGERPGSGHHTLSIYMTSADGSAWMVQNTVDHNITKVVSGIAFTALSPADAATDAVRILRQMA
jgi:ethanolamine ammonia-lyase large subunit